jgi:hypothetical protein
LHRPPTPGLLAGHLLLSRHLVGIISPQASAAQLYSNAAALIMQQQKLAALLADALLLALRHDKPYALHYISLLASACSKDLGSHQTAAGEQQASGEARACAMLQVLVLVAAPDAALAALLLKVSVRSAASPAAPHMSARSPS